MNENQLVPVFVPPPIGGFIENQNSYKYKVLKILTNGAFGSILLGVDLFENLYAIKIFRPAGRTYHDVRNMWHNEAKILRSLFHPYIAYLHDAFEYKHAFYLVFEFLGTPLSKFARGQVTLNDEQILSVAHDIFYGLSFIHWHGLVHRDLSLDNVLYDRNNTCVKITDFGISKHFQPAVTPTASNEPPYFNHAIVCPDLIRTGYTTQQSDLYHVGLILLALKLGKPPIDSSKSFDEIQRLCIEGYPRTLAEGLHCPLGDKIAILLRRRAEYRYLSTVDAWIDFRTLAKNRMFD